MRARYDAVVIGSGFGGGAVACRLAAAGRSVCVLERGRRWGKEQFPRTTGQVSRAFWHADSRGFLEYRAFRRVDVLQASGVGGGSLCYFNVRLRAPADVVKAPAWPSPFSRALLDPYYQLAGEVLEARPLRPSAGQPLPARTEAFLAAARGAGLRAEMVDIAVHTGPDRPSAAGVHTQSACTYCGNCMFGCHTHAKNTVDLNYLELAERHGAEVHALHRAERIERGDDGTYRVWFERLSEPGDASGAGGAGGVGGATDGGRGDTGRVEAPIVVLSAGSLGSTELLLRCRDQHRTLPALSPALGTRFSTNGDFIFAGARGLPRQVDPGHGPSITACVEVATAAGRILIQDLGYPDPLLWFLEGVLPSRQRLASAAMLVADYLAASLVGARRGRGSEDLRALFRHGRTTHFLPYLGMGTDAADGVLRLRDGALDLEWHHRRSRALFRDMERAMKTLSRAAGGRYTTGALWRWPLRKLLTAHPLGGCVVSAGPADGVVDHRGQVWGYPGLFVADGAVIPSALAVNPSFTISALAERTAHWLLHGRDYSSG